MSRRHEAAIVDALRAEVADLRERVERIEARRTPPPDRDVALVRALREWMDAFAATPIDANVVASESFTVVEVLAHAAPESALGRALEDAGIVGSRHPARCLGKWFQRIEGLAVDGAHLGREANKRERAGRLWRVYVTYTTGDNPLPPSPRLVREWGA